MGTRLALAVALAAALLSGCSDDARDDRRGGTAAPAPDLPPIQEALDLLPADAPVVALTGQAATSERLGMDDVRTGSDVDSLLRWMRAMGRERQLSALSGDLIEMQDAAFSDLDLEWQAVAEADSFSPVRAMVWKMSADLDFAKVAADLEDAGYERSGPPEHPRYQANLSHLDETGNIGGRYPIRWRDLVLVPGRRLILAGHEIDRVLAVLDGEEPSLADSGRFDAVAEAAAGDGPLESALLGDAPCVPGGFGLVVRSGRPVRGLRLLPDAGAAKQEARRLRRALKQYDARHDPDVPITVTTDGAVVRAEAPFADRLRLFPYLERGGPLACADPGAPATPAA